MSVSLLVGVLGVTTGLPLPAAVLDTPRYRIEIDVRCPEGSVTCDDVRYRGVSKRSGRSLALVGRTLHTRCADGVTPCRFLGYVFRHGSVEYFVSDMGQLLVRDGERVLVDEAGAWQTPP